MALLDPTTPIGKVRLRIGDFSDLPILPDSVIQSALDDKAGSVTGATVLCATYILAILTAKTHTKLSQLEMWGSERFDNYRKFIETVIKDPTMSDIAPIPYDGVSDDEPSPIEDFIYFWKNGYQPGAVVEAPTGPGDVVDYDYGI